MVSSLFRAAIRAGCVGALLFAAGPVLAQGGEVSVGTGKTSIRIVAPGTGGNNVTRLQTNRQFVSRLLKQVTIINGNNPLNQIDPVRNNNGQVFASLEDAVNANQGNNNGGGGGGLANCQGVTVQMQASGTAPPDFRFASLDIDPNTGDCTVVADGSTGSALIAQIPANGGGRLHGGGGVSRQARRPVRVRSTGCNRC